MKVGGSVYVRIVQFQRNVRTVCGRDVKYDTRGNFITTTKLKWD